MKKFRFTDEFETGLIVKNDILILDGKKVKFKSPILGDIGMEGIPCLVRTDSGKKITVEAVSYEVSDIGRRNWICLRPMVYEEAFGFFLKQYMRGKVIREYNVIRKCSGKGQIRCDYIVGDGDVAIEIKPIVPVISAHKGNIQTKLPARSADYFGTCFDHLTAVKDIVKRKILVIICLYGVKEEILEYCGEEILKSAKENGVEIWLAEMLVDADGIELASYQNVEDRHA